MFRFYLVVPRMGNSVKTLEDFQRNLRIEVIKSEIKKYQDYKL